jgi:hypothetical protein
MTLAKARANKAFIVKASLTIVTFDSQNIFIVQALVSRRLLKLVLESVSEKVEF